MGCRPANVSDTFGTGNPAVPASYGLGRQSATGCSTLGGSGSYTLPKPPKSLQATRRSRYGSLPDLQAPIRPPRLVGALLVPRQHRHQGGGLMARRQRRGWFTRLLAALRGDNQDRESVCTQLRSGARPVIRTVGVGSAGTVRPQPQVPPPNYPSARRDGCPRPLPERRAHLPQVPSRRRGPFGDRGRRRESPAIRSRAR